MRLLKIDADHRYWPEFRALVKRGYDRDVIRVVILKLWVWFAYMSEVDDYGFLAESRRDGLREELADGTVTKGVDWVEELIRAKMFQHDECRGGYWCKRFISLHSHLERGYWAREEYDIALRAYRKRVTLHRRNIPQFFEELMKSDWFALSMKEHENIADRAHDALWLVIAIDSALGLENRPLQKFTPSLINSAFTVVVTYERTTLKVILQGILQYRQSPKLPATTELILQNWESVHKLVLGCYDSKSLHNMRKEEPVSKED